MELLAAWKESNAGSIKWRLVIAGPDDVVTAPKSKAKSID